MIRYYISPIVDDGLLPWEGGKAVHAKLVDYLPYEFGSSINCVGPHSAGWMLVVVDRQDHSALDAATDIIDITQGALDTASNKAQAFTNLDRGIPANKQKAINKVLSNKGIDTTGLLTLRDVVDRVIKSIQPGARLEDVGV